MYKRQVHGLTLYFQSVLRGFEHIAEHAALVFIIAAAACVTLFSGSLSRMNIQEPFFAFPVLR